MLSPTGYSELEAPVVTIAGCDSHEVAVSASPADPYATWYLSFGWNP